MSNLDRRMDRFAGLDWAEYIIKFKSRYEEIFTNVIGAGGIGSWLSLLLARTGVQVKVFDFDDVEDINVAGQLYGSSSIGLKKVNAIQNIVTEFCGEGNLMVYDDKVRPEFVPTTKFMFSALDNMAARKLLFDSWHRRFRLNPEAIFIDGRLLAEQFTIFCVTNANAERYIEYLYTDAEVPDVHCTMKQTSHIAAIIAGYMTAFFTNHLSNLATDSKGKSVPFKYEVFTPLNYNSHED